MKIERCFVTNKLHLLLMFLVLCFTSTAFTQIDFSRDDSYYCSGKHYLRAFGTSIDNFTINIESDSDFHNKFKLCIIKSRLKLGALWLPYKYRVDMNNDGTWEQDWTSSGDLTISYYYPNPTNGISSNHTIKVEIDYSNINGQTGFKRTKYHEVTVFSTPRVYVNSENDAFVQLRNEDCTSKIPVLFVEGFDPLNDKFPETYYNLTWELVNTDLYPNNYEVFILNFHDGGRDLRLNADVLMKCIQKIHQICPNYQIAVGGLSMGGPITRYALAEMEELGGNHNVGLFMSYDSPQDGAHTNPGLQDWIKGEDPNEGVIGILQSNLNSVAAKQMLRYNTYDPTHIYRNEFYSDLNGLNGDGYPHKSYNVAVGNGNLQATHGNGSIGRHLLTLRVNDALIHDVAAVEFDCETGSKMTDITMTRYADIFSNPFIHVWYELSIIFNPSYIPTWSGLDLVNWQDDSFGNIISFDHSKFDDYVIQTTPLEHHELSNLTRNEIMNWLDLDFNIEVNYDLINGGTTNPDNYQVNILHGVPIQVEPKTVNVNGRDVTYNFLEWWDGNTTNPRTFYASHDVAKTTKMKGNLVSNSTNATASNNQRKIVRDNSGIYHLVYTDNGEVYYSSSSNGTDWNDEIQISDGHVYGDNKYPSISIGANNKYHIVWQQFNGWNAYVIKYKKQGVSGISEIGYSTQSTVKPVLANRSVFDFVNVFWNDGTGLKFKVFTDELKWSDLESVPNTNSSSYYPTVIHDGTSTYATHLAWQNGNNIYYQNMHWFVEEDEYYFNWRHYKNISDLEEVELKSNMFPSISVSADRKPVVVWQAEDTEYDRSVIVYRKKTSTASSNWGTVTEFYGSYISYRPAIATYENSYTNASIVWKTHTNQIKLVSNEEEEWGSIQNVSNYGYDPNISTQGILSQMIFRKYNSLPYFIKTEFTGILKGTTSNFANISRTAVFPIHAFQNGDTLNTRDVGKVVFEIEKIEIDNSIPIPFTSINDTLLDQPFFRTSTIITNSRINLQYDLKLKDVNVQQITRNISNYSGDLITVVLKDSKSGTVLRKFHKININDLLLNQRIKNVLNIDLGNYVNKPVIVEVLFNTNPKIQFEQKRKIAYEDSETPVNKTFGTESTITSNQPITEFHLSDCYPNPFNPTTNISFDIPELSTVSLIVYDIQGKSVSNLFNGQIDVGKYTEKFNGSNLSSGIYFYEMVAKVNTTGKTFRQVKRMLLIK